ncbi:DNA cytosine methyltransferase [Candidatus Enterovibrio escicola]|uniref:DNA cytosine methyltransferase n=1 Tax=Candidatus Enterovibrio escicola TaxID=1927127 RepID=UPI001237B4AA|nr:DNA cytosine methyltransferase [Candidatus Enterovibrio escacola]
MSLAILDQVFEHGNPEGKEKFTFIDLFAGIGGFHEALKSIGGKCVAACEIDKNARETYLANHKIPKDKFFDDIHLINPTDIPSHDILCAGFPCQPFSISGKQNALNDKRSQVVDPLFKIIECKKPNIVILENVKHLKHVSKGAVFEHILSRLENTGYHVSADLLNAKHFGVPQNRERWIIVGTKYRKFKFKNQNQKNVTLRSILEDKSDFEYLDEPYTLIDIPKKQEASGLLFCGYRNKGIRKAGVREGTEHLSRVHKQPNRIYSIDGTHPTIPSQETSGRFWIKIDDRKVRKLTINECFRLMGFKDSFKKPVATGQLYRQIGNSVCVPMIKEVASSLIEFHLVYKEDSCIRGIANEV